MLNKTVRLWKKAICNQKMIAATWHYDSAPRHTDGVSGSSWVNADWQNYSTPPIALTWLWQTSFCSRGSRLSWKGSILESLKISKTSWLKFGTRSPLKPSRMHTVQRKVTGKSVWMAKGRTLKNFNNRNNILNKFLSTNLIVLLSRQITHVLSVTSLRLAQKSYKSLHNKNIIICFS